MNKQRLSFAKEGRAVYISHLDLMRTFQRAFLRAGVRLRHSEGFNPHPLLFLALPLSVGQESVCELLDFESIDSTAGLTERLNGALPEGITARSVYTSARRFAQIQWVGVTGRLFYNSGVPEDAITRLGAYFRSPEAILSKKTKRGVSEIDLSKAVRDLTFSTDGETIALRAAVSAQNPSVNPALIAEAARGLPGLAPDFAAFRRAELFDDTMNSFK